MTGKEECLARAVAGGEQPAKTRAEQLLSHLVREGLELLDADRFWLHGPVKAASPGFNNPPVRGERNPPVRGAGLTFCAASPRPRRLPITDGPTHRRDGGV